MAASCFFTLPRISSSSQLNYPRLASTVSHDFPAAQHSVRTTNHTRGNLRNGCSFLGGRRIFVHRRSLGVSASLLSASQIASSAFTWGTVAVLPFYTFMVVAPKSHLTKKMMASGTPFITLGLLYGYLLYLSWTPDTIHLMFASKYWLPELPGIAKMFANDMTLASAWIHLLAVDLYAAKQVYEDGMQNDVETRHSVSLCLLFCPIGILVHIITKALAGRDEKHTIQ